MFVDKTVIVLGRRALLEAMTPSSYASHLYSVLLQIMPMKAQNKYFCNTGQAMPRFQVKTHLFNFLCHRSATVNTQNNKNYVNGG